jgi:hypothetical protein
VGPLIPKLLTMVAVAGLAGLCQLQPFIMRDKAQLSIAVPPREWIRRVRWIVGEYARLRGRQREFN